MKILLVNVDSPFNLAIRRMYNYFRKENIVDMMDLHFKGYPHNKTKTINAEGYDRVYISNIFEINKDRVKVEGCSWVEYGGIGSNFPMNKLPPEIEATPPFYFDYEDTSVGFITRGCIRNCYFCKVPKYEGKLKEYNSVEEVVGNHKKVMFLDNNILAYDKHQEVFQWLIDHKIHCDFNQGLDFRLLTEKDMELLSKLRYESEYVFAFDDVKYQKMLDEKIQIMKKYVPKKYRLKFYIYYNPKDDLKEMITRIQWCRKHECLPYIMRDAKCWEAEEDKKNFITDLCAYCNQPAFFKKMSFEVFLQKRRDSKSISEERRLKDLEILNKVLSEM